MRAPFRPFVAREHHSPLDVSKGELRMSMLRSLTAAVLSPPLRVGAGGSAGARSGGDHT